ncbi:hypothetical protein CEW89_05455 [Celeribacter ethanolicus]|uniref:Uncharacterized protein n=1 Tax=Celeribacter ethanolicus TaxID=1758178 RepID=A0A291GA86_9RHOB|nr:hypothetical protein [Celeribacter ethanolicus]ATG47068.1 hypothetical protein CEW89_05455 [Celeribacter ethanolicus]TNE64710.1 MAG: hypothetical protein EP336_14545 [Paracoccaceae bacterium]
MPLLSIAIDHALWQARQEALMAALPDLRAMLCERLTVAPDFAHLTVVPVFGLPDQSQVNADLRVLGKAERGPEVLEDVAERLQVRLSAICDSRASVRITVMDPGGYFARR